MFENTPSDKVRFLALGELPPPGSCLICGSGNREEGYVDIGVWVEYVGEGLICHTCVIEIGEKIGMMIPEEVKHLTDMSEYLATKNLELKKELANAHERLNALDLLLGSNHAAYLTAIGVNPESSSEGSDGEPLRAGSGESETTESDSSDGRSDGAGKTKQDDGSSEADSGESGLSVLESLKL